MYTDLRQAIVHSKFSASSTARDLFKPDLLSQCTHGVVFFGTPHLGANLAAVQKTVLNILKTFTHTNNRLVEKLVPKSEVLRSVQDHYAQISSHISNVFFYEQRPTVLLLFGHHFVSWHITRVESSVGLYGTDSWCPKSRQHQPATKSCAKQCRRITSK